MNTRPLIIAAGASFILAMSAVPTFAATIGDDCTFTPPRAEGPAPGKLPGESTTDTLTDRLTACGTVLNPPALGDPDIIEPTPPVGDDMNIHPDAPVVRP